MTIDFRDITRIQGQDPLDIIEDEPQGDLASYTKHILVRVSLKSPMVATQTKSKIYTRRFDVTSDFKAREDHDG